MIANLEPGLISLPMEVYQADPCPSPSLSSGIANILLTQSAAHAWLAHPRLNPFYEREFDSRFDLGSGMHALLLERDYSKIVWVNAKDWRTSEAKRIRDEAQAEGKMPILGHYQPAMEKAVEVARAYIDGTELKGIFDNGIAEQSLFWTEGDIWCRARPDLISADRRIIMDYKTCESAAPDVFGRQIGRMGYDLQAEFYLRGMEHCCPLHRPGEVIVIEAPAGIVGAFGIGRYTATFVFLVQEISPPYACSLISLSNAYREVGRLKVERALKIWDRCTSENSWPVYDTQILYIEPSSWQMAELESPTAGEW
jgi:hypothetical protein